MTLRFSSKQVPREWWDASPTSIEALRATLHSSDIGPLVEDTVFRVLDELQLYLQQGDILYRFASPPETWARMMGFGGFIIVRDDKVVHTIETICN